MPRIRKSITNNSKDPKVLILGTILVLLLIVLAVTLVSDIPSNPSIKQVAKTIQPPLLAKNVVATSAAKLKPATLPENATKPAPIPPNLGKSVNVPIIYYHYISNNPNPADKARYSLSVSPDKFDGQMGYLAKVGYNPITLDTLYAGLKNGGLPGKPIVLSFDDGYGDFYLNAYPILRKYSFHAVEFIPTSLIGTGYYLNWDQISEMNSSGLISFEAHSLTHPNLVALSYTDQKNQIFASKKILESHLGHPVNFFAYPYGSSNSTSWDLVKQAGYLGAVGTWGGTIESEGNIFDMPRIRVAGQSDATWLSKRF